MAVVINTEAHSSIPINDYRNTAPVSLSDWKEHPLIQAFRQMRLLRRDLIEDGNGALCMVEVREDPTSGERQKLTYRLDTHEEGL